MRSIPQTLTSSEMEMAAHIGFLRNIASLQSGGEPAAGFEGPGWAIHIEGACGELAVAKYLNRYWPGHINTFNRLPDILPDIEVRTRSREDYQLIVRPKDVNLRKFVHVTGEAPNFLIWGWMYGEDAKAHADWQANHGGRPTAWFVPTDQLWSMSEID